MTSKERQIAELAACTASMIMRSLIMIGMIGMNGGRLTRAGGRGGNG